MEIMEIPQELEGNISSPVKRLITRSNALNPFKEEGG
jgi:hypothetical protein